MNHTEALNFSFHHFSGNYDNKSDNIVHIYIFNNTNAFWKLCATIWSGYLLYQQVVLAPQPQNSVKRVIHLGHLELMTSSLWTNEIVLG